MPKCVLADRTILSVSGPDAATYLQGLLTSDVVDLADGGASSAALLTPQGKILLDMLIARGGPGFLIDCHADTAEAFARRLGFYRLRANVEITPRPDLAVAWTPIGEDVPAKGVTFADPRLAALGHRTIAASAEPASSEAYHTMRITAGIAESGTDYDAEAVFPHEANLDLLGGIDFAKGCFVGQEVVSRVHHRGSARKRFHPCHVDGALPAPGAAVAVDGREIGTVGSSSGSVALALLRLDRLAEAETQGSPVTAGMTLLAPYRPEWMAFAAPNGKAAAE